VHPLNQVRHVTGYCIYDKDDEDLVESAVRSLGNICGESKWLKVFLDPR
jgi:hypothetical protein